MKKLVAFTLLTLSIVSVSAQEMSMPVIREQWTELQQFLVLSTAQLSTLEQIYNSRQQAQQAIYRQISEKHQQLGALLQQGSNDVTAIGRLMVDINNLNRQLPLEGAPYRTQALAVLNDTQKVKLPALVDALRLQAAAWQGANLSLIDSPNVPDPRILPAPAVFKEGTNVLRSAR